MNIDEFITFFKMKITFITPILGSQPNRDIAKKHLIASAKRRHQEIPSEEWEAQEETIPEDTEIGETTFHRFQGRPVIWAYVLRGFAKNAIRAFSQANIKNLGKVKQLQSKFLNTVSFDPTMMELVLPKTMYIPSSWKINEDDKRIISMSENDIIPIKEGIPEGYLPYPAEILHYPHPLPGIWTPQGIRSSISNPELAPAGSYIICTVRILGTTITEEIIKTLFAYGELFEGMGQWRSAYWGRFTFTFEKI